MMTRAREAPLAGTRAIASVVRMQVGVSHSHHHCCNNHSGTTSLCRRKTKTTISCNNTMCFFSLSLSKFILMDP